MASAYPRLPNPDHNKAHGQSMAIKGLGDISGISGLLGTRTFGDGNGNSSAYFQILGTGMGMINSIPNFWERKRE